MDKSSSVGTGPFALLKHVFLKNIFYRLIYRISYRLTTTLSLVRLQRLAEEFLDTPIGDEELGEKPAMRKDNADKRMEQLGMSTKESEFFKQRALSTLGYGIQWKKVPLKEALAEAIRKGRVPAELAEGMKLLEGARTMAGEVSK